MTHVKFENIKQGGYSHMELSGNTYVLYYHATADKYLTCREHKSNSSFVKNVSGCMQEGNEDSFKET